MLFHHELLVCLKLLQYASTLSEATNTSSIRLDSSRLHRYAQRKGVPFSALWFGFGEVPSNITSVKYTAVLNEASSIYFINLVVMYVFPCHA
jgi:hypothetical protein